MVYLGVWCGVVLGTYGDNGGIVGCIMGCGAGRVLWLSGVCSFGFCVVRCGERTVV